MVHAEFVHLHVHTSYSLLDGACRIDDLTELAAKMKFPALAITDHGAMFGAVEFYQAAQRAGIKPIIGQEFYVAPKSRFDRQADGNGETSYHLVLLARDATGYANLLKLSSASYREGFYYKPRVDKELLAAHSQGLVALSACLKGEVSFQLLRVGADRAREAAAQYRDIFGEHFFLEVQQNGLPDQARANDGLRRISSDLGIPLVATNDVHYLRREDQKMHDVLLCIQTGKTMSDPDRFRMESEDLYLKPAEEMQAQFRDYPEALRSTLAIAERCNLDLAMGKFHLPRFPVPEDRTTESFLSDTVRSGFEARMLKVLAKAPDGKQEEVREAYQARLGRELSVITDMGFAGYFLIVWDFIRHAKEEGIPVGPGRGSAAGSLVAFSLGITDLDPIANGLIFERFLNPERINMPDIDVDFCMDRRDEVLAYVSSKYGQDRVAQIITFGTMMAKGSIRDVGRVLNMNYADVDRVAKLVPETPGITLEEAFAQEPRLGDLRKDKKYSELLDLAQKIEGIHRHASTHAAGVVIGDGPLDERVPLYKGTKGDEILTQYAMKSLEALGLVKFDFLGLRTLTLLKNAVDLVNRRLASEGKPPLDLEGQPLDDAATYELLSRGQTDGVFQLESAGMKDLLVKMKPGTFGDLVALVALYRPGPLRSGMVEDFIERKQGRAAITYELPQIEEILRETYGVIVYQEQVMQIASTVAGYTLGQADILRKAMGKKDVEKMAMQRPAFLEGASRRGIPEAKAMRLFESMAKFAEYGFNKSHSAAYSVITYRTAYLKAHYPCEFMAALLTSEMDNTDKVISHINVTRKMGIRLLPPDINKSEIAFTVTAEGIRFGLGAVKNAGVNALDEVLARRSEAGPFASLEDFCGRVDTRKVNRRVIESLIKAGAFEGLPGHRAQLLAALDAAMERGHKAQRDRENGQMAMFGIDSSGPKAGLPDAEPWSEQQRLACEKESLGFYITGHPLEKYRRELERYVTAFLDRLPELGEGQEVKVAGIVQSLREKTTSRGDRMAFVTLEDLHGSGELIVFSDAYRETAPMLSTDEPLIVTGTVERNGEKPKIRVSRLDLLKNFRAQTTRTVTISLTTLGLAETDLEDLKAILERHRGECALRLRLTIPRMAEVLVRTDGSLRVGPTDELVRDVESRFATGTVTFE